MPYLRRQWIEETIKLHVCAATQVDIGNKTTLLGRVNGEYAHRCHRRYHFGPRLCGRILRGRGLHKIAPRQDRRGRRHQIRSYLRRCRRQRLEIRCAQNSLLPQKFQQFCSLLLGSPCERFRLVGVEHSFGHEQLQQQVGRDGGSGRCRGRRCGNISANPGVIITRLNATTETKITFLTCIPFLLLPSFLVMSRPYRRGPSDATGRSAHSLALYGASRCDGHHTCWYHVYGNRRRVGYCCGSASSRIAWNLQTKSLLWRASRP